MVQSYIDFNISSWFVFYLECDKGRESSSYQVYIEFCYSYVLVSSIKLKYDLFFVLIWNKKCILPQDNSYH
jgi:hypothetical protein